MDDNTNFIIAEQSDELVSSIEQAGEIDSFAPIYCKFATSSHKLSAERIRETPMKSDAIPRSDPPLADGPCHPYTWRHAGIPVDDHMQPGAWKLVDHLWKQQDLAATFDDLKHPVYDDREHTAGDEAFGSLRRAANKFFKTHGISWRISIKKKIVHLSRSK
jgi:hypothetical protein